MINQQGQQPMTFTRNFHDAIVEYRHFDNNTQPVTEPVEGGFSIGRTDDAYFGRRWYAISPVGFNMGAGTVDAVTAIASTAVISDRANAVKVTVIRSIKTNLNGQYCQNVFVDGKHIATFKPLVFGRGYTLIDLSGYGVSVGYDNITITAGVNTKDQMVSLVRHWFEHIPNEAAIVKRDKKAAAKKAREQAEIVEQARVALINKHGVELLDALEGMMDMHAPRNPLTVYDGPYEAARIAINKAKGLDQ